MSYTNTTEHYNLPQYIGTDKPTYLGDMNSAYRIIDAKLYEAVTNASAASEAARDAAQTASSASKTATENKTNIANVNASLLNLSNNVNNSKIKVKKREFTFSSSSNKIVPRSGDKIEVTVIEIPNIGTITSIKGEASFDTPESVKTENVILYTLLSNLTINGLYDYLPSGFGVGPYQAIFNSGISECTMQFDDTTTWRNMCWPFSLRRAGTSSGEIMVHSGGPANTYYRGSSLALMFNTTFITNN